MGCPGIDLGSLWDAPWTLIGHPLAALLPESWVPECLTKRSPHIQPQDSGRLDVGNPGIKYFGTPSGVSWALQRGDSAAAERQIQPHHLPIPRPQQRQIVSVALRQNNNNNNNLEGGGVYGFANTNYIQKEYLLSTLSR